MLPCCPPDSATAFVAVYGYSYSSSKQQSVTRPSMQYTPLLLVGRGAASRPTHSTRKSIYGTTLLFRCYGASTVHTRHTILLYCRENPTYDEAMVTQVRIRFTPYHSFFAYLFPQCLACRSATTQRLSEGASVGAGVASAHGAEGHCSRRHAFGGQPHPCALGGERRRDYGQTVAAFTNYLPVHDVQI